MVEIYKQIRYKSTFKTKQEAKDGMKKAKAFSLMGIGKWVIEEQDGLFDLIFKPGWGLKAALNKAPMMWFQVAKQTQKAFRDELKTDKIVAIVE